MSWHTVETNTYKVNHEYILVARQHVQLNYSFIALWYLSHQGMVFPSGGFPLLSPWFKNCGL